MTDLERLLSAAGATPARPSRKRRATPASRPAKKRRVQVESEAEPMEPPRSWARALREADEGEVAAFWTTLFPHEGARGVLAVRSAVKVALDPLNLSSTHLADLLLLKWEELPVEAFLPEGEAPQPHLLVEGLLQALALFGRVLRGQSTRRTAVKVRAAIGGLPMHLVRPFVLRSWGSAAQLARRIGADATRGLPVEGEVEDFLRQLRYDSQEFAAAHPPSRTLGRAPSAAPPAPSAPSGPSAREICGATLYGQLKRRGFHVNSVLGNVTQPPRGPWKVLGERERSDREWWRANAPEISFKDVQDAQRRALATGRSR